MRNIQAGIFNSVTMRIMAGIQKSKFTHSKTLCLGIPNTVENV